MRTASRLTLSALALGGAMMMGSPALAQEACPYPFDPADPRCATEVEDTECPYPFDPADPRCTEVEGTVQDRPAPSSETTDAATLPFTGGELTVLGLVGAGALAGGVALVAAARKRKTA